jgi:hypothetical protein
MAKNGKCKGALVGARANGMTVKESAKLAGISERTAYRRLAEAQTAQEIASVSEELDWVTLQHFLWMRKRALEVLAEGMESPDEATRLKSARMILDHTDRLHERHVLLAEVHRLRELMSLSEISNGGSPNGSG